jgi:hypothetical protein
VRSCQSGGWRALSALNTPAWPSIGAKVSAGATPRLNQRMVALIGLHPSRLFGITGNTSELRKALSCRNQVLTSPQLALGCADCRASHERRVDGKARLT